MSQSVVAQVNFVAFQFSAVHFETCHTTMDRLGIIYLNPIHRLPATIGDFKFTPALRNARIDLQTLSAQFESENGFESGAIHPTRRTGIPRPTPTSSVWRHGVDVAHRHVRLDFVLVQAGTR